MQVKKRSFSLVEVLVAVGILSILLVFLFGCYREVSWLNEQGRHLREESFQLRYAQYRLSHSLPKTVLSIPASAAKKRELYFYTSDTSNHDMEAGSLVFTFDNGPKLPPTFAGVVLGRLYVDRDKNLCLAVWPLPPEKGPYPTMPVEREVLLNHVEGLSFEFFVPPDPSDKKVNPEPVTAGVHKTPPPPGWRNDWTRTFTGLPAIVRVHVKRKLPQEKEEELTYAFVISNSQRTVFYKEQ